MLSPEYLGYLQSLVSADRISVGESELQLHARDESYHDERRPDIVIYPISTQEISKILGYANSKKIPVTPWGAGTSMEGNPIPLQGGIVLDVSRMNQILEIREKDLQVVVQPGVVHTELNQKLAKHGLFFPPDPGAPATIGGMVANNAAGIQAVKYGATKQYVVKLEVVLSSGEIIKVGTNAMRTSSGYDVVHLFVGSEGTLGVFTEITLKLVGIPREVSAALAAFPSLEQACQTVLHLVQGGLSPAALELMDVDAIRALNAFKEVKLREEPTLMLEFRGNGAEVKEDVDLARELCAANGCSQFTVGIGKEQRDKLWEARHHLLYAAAALNPGKRIIVTDVAVPISKFPELVIYAKAKLSELGVPGAIVGHAGDGNFHVGNFYDPAKPEEKSRAQSVNDAIVQRALEMGGTATGEHGVGIGKTKFMAAEHGASLSLMKQIKALIDPNGIMNPGKKL